MCSGCAQELQNFHNFYMRIELAHKNLANLVKTEDEKDNEGHKGVYKEMADCHAEPEIILEQPMSTEFGSDVACIKTEVEEVDSEDIPLKYSLKTDHFTKDLPKEIVKDPLEKTKKSKQNKILINSARKLRLKSKKSNCSRENKTVTSKTKDITEDPDAYNEIEKNKSSSKSTEEEDVEYSGESVTKKASTKNQAKQRNNPDAQTLKEYDRIIADNFQIECHICQITFENFVTLRKHFRVEHKQRGYARCCNRNFFSRSVLVDHIHLHMNPNHFKCQECGKVFSDRSTLVGHMKLHDDVSKLEKCNECGKVFVSSAKLKTHLLTHYSTEKMFPCTICGKFFTNTSILNHHIEAVHENKFVQICNICGKSIRCPTAFASHMETHELKTTPLSCDVCGLLLANKMGLKRHKNSQHPEGGKKEHKCHICSKISPTLRALKSHIQRAHEMGYDYKCTLCEKAFKRPAVLKEHMATHTGTALYSCPWCPKTFISNGNMYNHRKNAHPTEWAELQRQKYADG
ncbi:uncharacterized protein ACRADG_010648 isoform 2-T4 [Cochliomyia hominivorax]